MASPKTERPSTMFGGRPAKVTWPAARAYWLALPDELRTLKRVAERFGVTEGRVSQVAKRDGWKRDLEKLQEVAARESLMAMAKIVKREARARAERTARTLEIYDRANDLALEMLPLIVEGEHAGELDVEALRKAGGLPRLDQLLERLPGLHRMVRLELDEATDHVAIASVQPVLVAFARIAVVNAPPERRGEIMRQLEEASAGLVPIEASP